MPHDILQKHAQSYLITNRQTSKQTNKQTNKQDRFDYENVVT